MLALLTYPFDVIKTNRILNTPLSKEAGHNMGREFVSLYEQGGLSRGAFRGMSLPILAIITSKFALSASPIDNLYTNILALSVVSNPLWAMQVHRHVAAARGHTVPTYSQIASSLGVGMFYKGLLPFLARNYILAAGLYPTHIGYTDFYLNALWAAASIVISHPFEVLRVQHQMGSSQSSGALDLVARLNA
jgi:hypothetical protein